MLVALGHAAAELVFYVLVGVWYLLTVQYDVVDRWLGSPNLNRVSAQSPSQRAPLNDGRCSSSTPFSTGDKPHHSGSQVDFMWRDHGRVICAIRCGVSVCRTHADDPCMCDV